MARPPAFPAEEKVRIVLSILAGEVTVAEAARRAVKEAEKAVNRFAQTHRGRPKAEVLRALEKALKGAGVEPDRKELGRLAEDISSS
jgi:transposase-like protein